MFETVEIKAAIYAVLASALFIAGWHTKSYIDEDRAKTTQLAEDALIAAQKDKDLALLTGQQQVSSQVASNYEQQLSQAKSTSDNLNSLVVRYESAIRSNLQNQVSNTSSGINATGPGASSSPGIEPEAGNAIAACTHDSLELTSLQDWVHKQEALLP